MFSFIFSLYTLIIEQHIPIQPCFVEFKTVFFIINTHFNHILLIQHMYPNVIEKFSIKVYLLKKIL